MIKLIPDLEQRILKHLVALEIKEVLKNKELPTSYLLINCTMGKPGYTILTK